MNGLYLVTVPIGNCEDITLRALNILKESTYIFCEDTRVFKDLAKRTGIDFTNKVIRSFHDHTGDKKAADIIELAKENLCSFVSDAGSPLLSDPAFPLIKLAIKENINLQSIGGVNSVVSALELSGLAPIPFHFHGFIARDNSKRNDDIATFKSQYGTHIFFEGVSRVIETLKFLSNKLPDFEFVVARELTKDYQSVYRFKGSDFSDIQDEITAKGEFVILLNNPLKAKQNTSDELVDLANEMIVGGAKPKKLAKLLGLITNKNSKDIYSSLNNNK